MNKKATLSIFPIIILIVFCLIFSGCERKKRYRTGGITQAEQNIETEQYEEIEQNDDEVEQNRAESEYQRMMESPSSAQARLTIENKSQRFMTVKIMKGDSINNFLHKIVTIPAYKSKTVNFSQTGYYFTKTKAELGKKEPVYQKGQPFKVINDSSGYSVLTITFSIKETEVPEMLGGKQISKSEFDKN